MYLHNTKSEIIKGKEKKKKYIKKKLLIKGKQRISPEAKLLIN